jgi:hypothetical protein
MPDFILKHIGWGLSKGVIVIDCEIATLGHIVVYEYLV